VSINRALLSSCSSQFFLFFFLGGSGKPSRHLSQALRQCPPTLFFLVQYPCLFSNFFVLAVIHAQSTRAPPSILNVKVRSSAQHPWTPHDAGHLSCALFGLFPALFNPPFWWHFLLRRLSSYVSQAQSFFLFGFSGS